MYRMVPGEPQQETKAERLLPLTPAVFHILLALANVECHGYGIMLEVDRITRGRLHIGPGTLYRSIQRMLVDGLIVERKEPVDSEIDDERRRYYRLSDFGLEVAQAEADRLNTLVKAAKLRGLLATKTNVARG
jgi:DNA-binding PadR family transcriptional regulator